MPNSTLSSLFIPVRPLPCPRPNFKFNIKAGYAHIFGTKEGLYNPLAIGVGMSYRFDTRK